VVDRRTSGRRSEMLVLEQDEIIKRLKGAVAVSDGERLRRSGPMSDGYST
jgi:hypothetical protein